MLAASSRITSHLTDGSALPGSDSTESAGRGHSFDSAKLASPSAREGLPDDGTAGWKLWGSAGTAAVKDINPGTAWSSPSALTSVNGTLFFSANGGTNGWELWKSDGPAAGTVMVKDI